MKTETKHGWGHPDMSKKYHYFVEGRSMCMKWLFLGELDKDDNGKAPRHDDCKDCWRRSRGLATAALRALESSDGSL